MASRTSNNPNKVLAARGRSGVGTKNASQIANLIFPVADNKLNMGMLFRFVKYTHSFGTGGSASVVVKDITKAHVALPLPENIQELLSLRYDVTDMGVAGLGMAAGTSAGEALKKGELNEEMMNDLAKGLGLGSEYLLRSLSQVSGPVAGAINVARGNVPNPFTTTLFQRVEPRTHNLSFRLTPESPADSVAIQNIINEFKFHALPGRDGTAFLTMPDEVELAFFGTNALYGFARCVISQVQVNYTPRNTPSFFKNSPDGLIGAPQAVELSLTLQEIEQLTRESYGFKSQEKKEITSEQGNEQKPRAETEQNNLVDRVVGKFTNRYGG